VAFSPNGKQVVSGSKDKSVKLWNAETGTELWTMRAHSEDNPDCTCQHYDEVGDEYYEQDPDCPVTVDSGDRGVRSVSFSHKGDMIAAGCWNGKIYLVDVLTGQAKRSVTGHRYALFL
jgi:WD40 repeat protein